MTSANSKPILVVGAGPTGLTLAAELARHGAPVRIVDRLSGIVPLARATGVHTRTLEVFQDLGIAGEIVAQAAPMRGTRQYAGGELILHLRTDDLDSPFPFAASLEQWKVEEALVRLLGGFDLTVERETVLIALEDDGHRVHATLRHRNGDLETTETPWLIGCDGAHSTVRHLKGEHFPGEVDPRCYLVADAVLDDRRTPDEAHVYLTDHGVLWCYPLPDGRTLMAADVPASRATADAAPGLQDVQDLLDARAPGPVRASDPRWLNWFRIHYRLTPHYRHGRTFLAGDAAHIHSPIGGQGMNTGVQDAYNLAWKLALVVRGLAPEALLDSYEFERRAVALDVLETTRSLTEKAEAYVSLSAPERDRLFRQLALPDAERIRMLRHTEELDLDYRRSPICREHVEASTGEPYGLHAGAEARDAGALIVDGARVTLFDLLRSPLHTLILLPRAMPNGYSPGASLEDLAKDISQRYGDRVRTFLVWPPDDERGTACAAFATVVLDAGGELHRRYGASGGRLYLIRPDGYIGFRSGLADTEPLFGHFARVFTPPDTG